MDQAHNYIQNEIERITKEIEFNKKTLESEINTEMKKLYEEEIYSLQKQKEELEKSLDSSSYQPEKKNIISEGDFNLDPNVATMEIRSGTGGDEAGLFAKDLFRMYSRYGEKAKWKITEEYLNENEVGGIKTLIADIKGQNVYKLLKNESGVHRVQRIPVTESGGRIHTSTATVAVLPKLKNINIEIKPDDLKWEFYRSGGKGGQNVNKVSTAVRLTHIPTGTIVECQEERYQGKNREKALSILHSKLYTQMQEQHVKSITELRSSQVGTGERSEKIRTYNFPQDRITDHRINKTWHSIERVMNGDVENILEECSLIESQDNKND
ncbi:PCRF domain-containing protein [candidate division WWE3 bacterium]|uniref:PCRF domain-containing protein n=1 Tax=candidate division WWE3 bacterium TaxID=2053526 RepID=A0A7X9E7U8_UNCKA|nr:PCRF domain-containing protein [candidate division WWE3 bacterium]